MSYKALSDEDKLEEAIRFIAVGQPLPEPLREFLQEAGLLDVVANPSGTSCPQN